VREEAVEPFAAERRCEAVEPGPLGLREERSGEVDAERIRQR
jgi:hypothetical protein